MSNSTGATPSSPATGPAQPNSPPTKLSPEDKALPADPKPDPAASPDPAENEWFEAPLQPKAPAVEPPTEAQVLEVPVVEEPVQVAIPTPVDESAPMARPTDPGRQEEAKESSSGSTIVVRYGVMQQLGEFSHDLPRAPLPGGKVVVRTERGVELGEVVVTVSTQPVWRCITSPRLREYIQGCGPEYPYTRGGKILRMATPQDIIDYRHLETSAREEGTYARQQIREMGLQMRLVTVEHLLGGERVIFYFSAETRVDFRELVRQLAAQFRTRIEMRQVGARDEARLVGDYERCGQRCCCQEYLKDLKPVSMRMAKTQKATLDPSKISGRCGRLMCCLRYEDTVYEDLRKRLPKKNIWVKTAKLVGKVIDVQIITQLVRILLPDMTQAVVANEEILERDVPPPAVKPTTPAPQPEEKRERRLLRDEFPVRKEPAAAQVPPSVEPQPVSVDGAVNAAEQVQPMDESVELAAEAQDAGDEPAGLEPAGVPAGGGVQDPNRQGRRRRRRRRGRGGQGEQGQQNAQAGRPGQNVPPQAQQPRPDMQSGGAAQASGTAGGNQAPGQQGQGEHGRRRRRGRRRGRGDGGGRPAGGPGGNGGGPSAPPAPPA